LGRRALALLAARAVFESSLSLEDFRAASMLEGPGWIVLRPHLLAGLATVKYARDRTEIYLSERMIEEAVRSVDFKSMPGISSEAVLMRLAGAAHANHPDWGIDIAGRMADGIMEVGNRGYVAVDAVAAAQTSVARPD
jgi:hypothetical protein